MKSEITREIKGEIKREMKGEMKRWKNILAMISEMRR